MAAARSFRTLPICLSVGGLFGILLLNPPHSTYGINAEIKKRQDITFNQSIKPMLNQNCMPCHSANGSGPFPLETYEQVKNRSELVRFQVLARLMPPVFTSSEYGQFSTGHTLSDQQIRDFQSWIQSGLPRGFEEGSLPTNQTPQLPGNSLKVNAPQVREEGVKYWMAIPISIPNEMTNIAGFEIKPDSPKAVRSVTLAIRSPKQFEAPIETFGSLDLPADQLVGTWAPGYRPLRFPEGIAKTLKPGDQLVAQVLYSPTGKPESGGFELKLIEPDSTTNKAVLNKTLKKDTFQIKAGDSPEFRLETVLEKDQTLISLLPEARFYASQIKLIATPPQGKAFTLFKTLYWDPYWIGNYQFQTPISLKRGTKLTAIFNYANDDKCAMNENRPPQLVTSGNKIDQELCRMHLFLVD